jgi:hypothetical protein
MKPNLILSSRMFYDDSRNAMTMNDTFKDQNDYLLVI